LNRREEEFDSKRAYDDFLEQREEIIANLVYGTDVAKTKAELAQYEAANAQSIRHNKALESQESAAFHEIQTLELEQIRLRREAARQDYDRERRELLAGREDVLTRLTAGSSANAASITREGQRVLLKKSSARRSEEDRIRRKQALLLADTKKATVPSSDVVTTHTPGSNLVRGLKKIKTPEPEKPYDPFAGLSILEERDYYAQQDSYPSSYLDPIRNDAKILAGGYDLREYYARTLLEAFAGLGCFIGDEVSARDLTTLAVAKAEHAATATPPMDIPPVSVGSSGNIF
jgi:CDK-activating kinase assembly factor MAT1